MHGYYTNKTWVGWQFKVLRSTDFGSTWHEYYASPIQKDKANDSIPADGFSRMAWVAPEHPTGYYLVRIHVWFYVPGSKTVSEGHAVVEYDNYKSKWNGVHHPSAEYCLQDY